MDADHRGGRRLFRGLIYGLVLTSAGVQQATMPILPAYAHRFGLTGMQQGLLLGATGFATLALALPAGALSDRMGARRITLWVGGLMAVATLIQAVAPSFQVLLVSRLLFGIGYGVIWTVGLSWLAGVSGGVSIAGSVASSGAGVVAGPALFGVLTQRFGLMVPFLGTALVFASLTFGLARLRVPPPAPALTPRLGAGLRAAGADRRTILAIAAIVVSGVTQGVCSLLVPSQLHSAGASTTTIGFAYSVAGVAYVTASVVTVSAGRRGIRAGVALAGMLALSLALSPGVLSSAPLVIVAMLTAATAARAVLWTVSYPLGAEGARHSGAGMGLVMGLLNGVWAVAAVLSPLATGLTVASLRPQAVFGVTEGVCLAVTAAAACLSWRTRPAAAPHRRPLGQALPGQVLRGHAFPGPGARRARVPRAGARRARVPRAGARRARVPRAGARRVSE